MNILKSKSTQKYYGKLEKHVVARKNKYFRRNVHINHEETVLRILRIKNKDQFNLEVKGFKTLPEDVSFFFFHIDKNYYFQDYLDVNDSEFILTDSKTNKIVALNTLIKNYPDFINIWIVKKNTINFFKLKIGDIFFTR